MARKKEAPKPMALLRHDFAAALDNLCHQGIMMLQVVDSIIQHDAVKPAIKGMLIERRDALRTALLGED